MLPVAEWIMVGIDIEAQHSVEASIILACTHAQAEISSQKITTAVMPPETPYPRNHIGLCRAFEFDHDG